MISVSQHLDDRNVDLKLHTVWCDECEGVATFPIYTLSGKMTGYQQYRPDANKEKKNHPREGRYYTYSIKSCRGVWGLESWKLTDRLFITEGIFCAARLTKLGCSAIATMSNDPKYLGGWFKAIRAMREVVAICDSGSAGLKLKKFAHTYHQMPPDFDLGDAPDSYVYKLVFTQ